MIRSLRDLPTLATPWLRRYKLSRGFWLFFIAALFYDAGFGLYFFLFNLYLADFHLNERTIGLVNGALSMGLVVGTLPAGALARRIGARRLLQWCFLVAPVVNVLRAIYVWEPAAIALAFLAGVVMCIWIVCFLPVTASLTSESNRAAATGLIFSIGIGAAACGAAVSGYLSQWIAARGSNLGPADVKRIVLMLASALVAFGVVPLMRLPEMTTAPSQHVAIRQYFALLRQPFLRRFVPCMALWSSLLAALTSFGALYFARERHVSLSHVGLIFSASQLAQLVGGLLVPLFERGLGMMKAILASQLATGILLAMTVLSADIRWSIVFFCGYAAAQWITLPAMYTLLMNNVDESDRAGASAFTMFSNSLVTAAANSGVGALLLGFGYRTVMIAIAGLACLLAIAFQWVISERVSPITAAPAAVGAESFTD